MGLGGGSHDGPFLACDSPACAEVSCLFPLTLELFDKYVGADGSTARRNLLKAPLFGESGGYLNSVTLFPALAFPFPPFFLIVN